MKRFPMAAVYAALACVCIKGGPMHAQQTINNASLEGRITDPQGALVVGAAVTITAIDSGSISHAQSDARGLFRVSYLPVGRYEIAAESAGFQRSLQTLTLAAGDSVSVVFVLRVGEVQTDTRVDGDLDSVSTRTEEAATILPVEVNELPFLSRNFLDLALLAPGVSATNTAATQLFAETSAVPGQGLSINSQRNFSNSFLIDGLSANDDAAGLVTTALPLDAVEQLQVVTAGGQAEYGRALGGYLNFVSRSGTNALHGVAYGFLRNQRLNAQNALSQSLLPLTQAQFGASVGGPVVHDRSFFFVNAEQRNLRQNGILTITPANAAAIDARLAATGYMGPQIAVGSGATSLFSNPVRATNLFAKLDQKLSETDQFSARYSLYHVSAQNSRGAGGLTYTSAAAALEDLDQTIAVSNIAMLSTKTVNETRAQFTNSNLAAPVNDPIGPAVSISGVASFGTLSASPTARYDRLYEVVDNLSHQAGTHALRAGADFLYNDLTITYPQSLRGSYAFSSLANFQAGKYSTFTQSFGNDVVPQTNPNLGVYAQDEWRASSTLTVNAGVRYDLQFLQSIATDTRNVSPRLGLAWTPFGDRRTVVRAGYGLFYDRVPLRALSNALESNGNSTALNSNTFVTLALSYGQAGAPVFPAIDAGYTVANLPPSFRVSLSTMDPNLKNAVSQQALLEVEQKLSAKLTLNMNFQHVRGEHLLISVNENTPTCLATVDPVNLCRPNAAVGNIKQYSSAADSIYDGLAFSLVERPNAFSSFRISYAWSHALDDVSEFFFSSPENNYDPSEDWARSDDDQRHRLTADASLNTPMAGATTLLAHLRNGWRLSGILQYDSALPFNVTTGGQTVQTTTQRPCAPGGSLVGVTPCTLALPGAVIGRNTGMGFNVVNLNARLARTVALGERVKLECIAQAFNALNHRNNQIPNATFGTGAYPAQPSATFGQPTAVADPRSVELALRLRF